MAEHLDVMVLESAPHAADAAGEQFETARHRARRGHRPGARPVPWVGITDPPTGLPIAEDGPEILDPDERCVTGRSSGGTDGSIDGSDEEAQP